MVSDETLATKLKSGDRSALAALFERHYDDLFGYLFRLTFGDRALAADLAQESFLRVLRGIHTYDSSRPLKAWLYGIATNAARNLAASADARHTGAMTAQSDEIESDTPPIEQTMIEAEASSGVIAALRQLPGHQREAIVLFYYQSFSHAQIAETLNIPVGTVKLRLSLGVKRLRELIEADL